MVTTRRGNSPLVELDNTSTDNNPEIHSQDNIEIAEAKVESNKHSPNGEQGQESDGEARERPLRKQLEKTTINRAGDDPEGDAHIYGGDSEATTFNDEQTRAESPGKESRKRSFEEARDTSAEVTDDVNRKHQRQSTSVHETRPQPVSGDSVAPQHATEEKTKPDPMPNDPSRTSQTSTPPPEPTLNGLAEAPLSPQNKRSRDAFLASQEAPPPAAAVSLAAVVAGESEDAATTASKDLATDEERSSKRHRDSPPLKEELTTNEPSKGLKDLKPPQASGNQPSTSPTKFAASGFAALASTASPFGSMGANTSTSSPFGTFGTSKPAEKPSQPSLSSGFAGVSGGFGSLSGQASGFGGIGGSSFGSAAASASPFASKGGAPLTSFASGKGDFGAAPSKPVKPIGVNTEAEEGDGSAEDEEGEDSNEVEDATVPESDEQDERFFEQEVETGEENERTLFTSRAKLYMTVEKQWKERGHGVFKVNAHHDDGSLFSKPGEEGGDKKVHARFLMRADGSHRLALNSPIKKELKVQDPSGGSPKGNTAVFLGWIEDKPTLLQLKLRNNQQVGEFVEIVNELQMRM